MSLPVSAMLYTQGFGSKPEILPFYSLAAPAPTNINFPLSQRWITLNAEYVLTSFTSFNGQTTANWTFLGNSGMDVALAGVTPSMVSGVVTISSPLILSSSILLYSTHIPSSTSGFYTSSVTTGAFTITSSTTLETSNFFYMVINP